MPSANPHRTQAPLYPIGGVVLFGLLYVLAAALYPGGSQADRTAPGFSWLHNYWCNLLNETAINGAPNPARPVALAAMGILCLSVGFFWYHVPRLLPATRWGTPLIRVAGILSMGSAFFLFTPYHDQAINVAGLLGLAALLATFRGLYGLQAKRLFWSGLALVPLVALNNFIYYTQAGIFWLPLLQKISFVYVLGWICSLSLATYNKLRNSLAPVGLPTENQCSGVG